MDKPSISLCVPVYNEEPSLRECVKDLLDTLLPQTSRLEIIIVDDGSRDSSAQIASRLAAEYSQVKLIRHRQNSGIGRCYRDALEIASADYFSWFPSDHENSAAEFLLCLQHLGKDTIVSCNHRLQDPRGWSRKKISRAYTWFLNKGFGLNLKYYNGLAIFPTQKLRASLPASDGFFILAESLIKAAKSGCKVVELDAFLRKREKGRSKAITAKAFIQLLKDLVRSLYSKPEQNSARAGEPARTGSQ